MEKRIKLTCETFLFLLLIGIYAWILPLTPIYTLLKGDFFYWNYPFSIMFIIIPIIIISFTKPNFRSYGINLKNWKLDSIWGIIFCIIIVLPALIALSFNYIQFIDNLTSSFILSTIIYQVIFSGFGEELFFRGYIQSRLNEAFDHPYGNVDLKYGPGIIITSINFSVMHILNPFSPFIGKFGFDFLSGLFTLGIGFFLGFLREKTDSILLPSIIHAVPDAFHSLLAGNFSFLGIIGWTTAIIFFFIVFVEKYPNKISGEQKKKVSCEII